MPAKSKSNNFCSTMTDQPMTDQQPQHGQQQPEGQQQPPAQPAASNGPAPPQPEQQSAPPPAQQEQQKEQQKEQPPPPNPQLDKYNEQVRDDACCMIVVCVRALVHHHTHTHTHASEAHICTITHLTARTIVDAQTCTHTRTRSGQT